MCNDLEFKTEMLDELINDTVDVLKVDKETNLDDIVNYIVDEWVSCSGINGYAISKLEECIKKEVL